MISRILGGRPCRNVVQFIPLLATEIKIILIHLVMQSPLLAHLYEIYKIYIFIYILEKLWMLLKEMLNVVPQKSVVHQNVRMSMSKHNARMLLLQLGVKQV